MSTQIIERMAVEVEGSGEPLVMLHGLGGTSNVYTPLMTTLGSRFRTLRFDWPGSGRSAATAPYSIQTMTDSIVRALRVLGVESAHVIGHSMGTIVCQHLAVQQPSLVKSLVLLGPVTALPDPGRQAMRERAAKVRSAGMAEIADALVNAATSNDTKSNQPVAVAFVRELLMRQDPEGYARNCEALADAQATDLAQIRCRTLLVTGDEDAVAPPQSVRAMAERIQHARVVILPRCGHCTTIERAREVDAELKEFYFGRR